MTPSAEHLLAHAGWMRALALGLVRDPAAADDVAQDAALAALLHPPPAGAQLRPWLGQVVRRLAWRRARSERRRAEREAWASEPAGPEDAGETLARLDLQRALLEAVRGLEEPVRTTIVQRYFEGRSAAEIAAASGVPASTVRARVARGLELLRARLDREAGSRAAWMALVAPLVPREFALPGAVTASTLASGALTMTLAKIVLVTGAAFVAGLAWWNFAPRGEPSELLVLVPSETSGDSAAPLAVEARIDDGPAADSQRAVAASALPEPDPGPVASKPAAEVEMRGRFEARVVNEHGAPWPGAELTVFRTSERDEPPLASGTSGSDGRAQVELTLPKWARRDRESTGGAAATFQLIVRRAGCAARRLEVVVRENDVTHLGEIVLVESGSLRGRVVDEHGDAITDARVGAFEAAAFEALNDSDRERSVRVGAKVFDELLAREVYPDGTFELDDVAPGRVRLWAHAPGRRFALVEPFDVVAGGVVDDLVVTLPALQSGDRVAGRVVGPDGKGRPAALTRHAQSSRGGEVDFLQTAMDGRFDFPVGHLDCVYDLSARDGYREFTDVRVSGVRPGDLEVVIAFGRGRSVRVRLSDERGVAVEEAELWISGQFSTSQADARVVEPGVYEVEWPSGRYALEIQAKGFRSLRGEPFDSASMPELIELTLQRAPSVRGVVSADGSPLAGAKIESLPFDATGGMTVNGLRCTVSTFENGASTSDSTSGQFELFVDADGPIVVRASAAGWVDAESEPFTLGTEPATLELALGRGGAIEGRVLVPAGESAAGRVVGAHRADGRPISTRAGEDGTYRFEGLMPGAWHVFPLAEEYRPRERHYGSTMSADPVPWSCRVDEGRTTRFDLTLANDQ